MDTQVNQNRSGKMKKITPAVFSLVQIAVLVIGMLAGFLNPLTVAAFHADDDQVEPQAGAWHTWVLETGSQLRPPAPPDKKQTKAEVQVLKDFAAQRDQAALDRIAYWNTGAPVYRWNEIAISETIENGQNTLIAGRTLALLHAAVYDATIAAWDGKYTYNRPRPHKFDSSLKTAIDSPNSPSYPSEHAATAGAASEILAYLFPERADFFRQKAQEAGQSFLIAGVQYPSDVQTGLELGRQVAALVIERAKTDGFDAQWDGTMPSGPGYWTGQNPVLPMAGTWKTWALASSSELRPSPPPAYNSVELAAEMAEVKNYQRTPKSNSQAFFWEYGAGGTRNYWFWNEQLSKKLLEYPQLKNNPPRAARAYALMHIAYYDSIVACWDAKYTYWAIRPFQLDPTFQTLFPSPNHPSYPSAHSCLSGAAGEILAYLFPRDAEMFRATVERAGEARIWAGLHFRSDIVAGLELGTAVAQKVIEHAKNDGAN